MSWLAFAGVAVVVIVAPGPDMALVGRNAVVGGRRSAIHTSLGVATGLVVWSAAAAVGVAALLAASEPAFTALRLAGAAYLVWLGICALCDAYGALRERDGVAPSRGPRLSPRRAYRQGLVSNLANPKIAVFFTSLLPQFAPPDGGVAPLLALGLLFCSMTFVWLAVYGAVVAGVGDIARRPRVRGALEALTGMVLVALGLRVATDRS